MSDTKLRDIERRWKETGTVEDEAAYLLERVRVGDLSQERLELAAYCGHEGAKAALRSHGQVLRDDEDWWRGLAKWKRDPAVAGLLAIAEDRLGRVTNGGDTEPDLFALLRAGREWLACPSAEHASEVARLGAQPERRLNSAYWAQELRGGEPPGEAEIEILATCVGLTRAIASQHDVDAAEHLLENHTTQTKVIGLQAVVAWALAPRRSSA